MPRVSGRGREAEVPIERNGPVVFAVNGKSAHADHVGDLKRAPKRVKQQPGADAVAFCVDVRAVGAAANVTGVLKFLVREKPPHPLESYTCSSSIYGRRRLDDLVFILFGA
jgi:hypothetical protein